jgi:predicted metal-binding membrane protein
MNAAPSRLTVWSAAITLAVAGLYQFTPLKGTVPSALPLAAWVPSHFGSYSGRLGDVRVGAYHGGCC